MKNTNQLHPVQLQQALVPVCKMVIKFGLQCNEFQKNIQRAYIHAAKELLKESNIKPTNQAIAVKTGMDRRTIAEHKNDSNKANRQPLNKMDMIVVELQRFKANSGKLSLGRSVLIKKIDKIYGGHIRAKAIITELLANNIVTENNRNYLINESLNKQLSKQSQLADEVDITTRRLFQTFYKKMFSSDSSFDLSQYTLVSGKVPPSQHNNLNAEIQSKMIEFQLEMKKIIHSYEANVPSDTYANIGLSQFQFDSQN